MKSEDDVKIIRPHPVSRVLAALVALLALGGALTVPITNFDHPYVGVLIVVPTAIVAWLWAVRLVTLELRVDDRGVTLASLIGRSSVVWRDRVRQLHDTGYNWPLRRILAFVMAVMTLTGSGVCMGFWHAAGPSVPPYGGGLVSGAAIAGCWATVDWIVRWGDRRLWRLKPLATLLVLADGAGRRVHVPWTLPSDDLAPVRDIVDRRYRADLLELAERASPGTLSGGCTSCPARPAGDL